MGSLGNGNGLRDCGNGNFCCIGLGGCDCKAEETFTLPVGTIVTTLPSTLPTSSPNTTSHNSSPAQTTSEPTTSNTANSSSSSVDGTSGAGDSSSTNKLAIGIGVGLGIPLVLAAVAFVLIWRRKKRAVKDMHLENEMPYWTHKNELDATSVEKVKVHVEMDARYSNYGYVNVEPVEIANEESR